MTEPVPDPGAPADGAAPEAPEPPATETTGASEQPTEPGSRSDAHRRRAATEPVLPGSKDGSDEGWGDHGDVDDDERLRREVPPHW